MAYGTIKVDTIIFTDAGVDKSISISGLVQNPTFTGNVTVTGTISGNTVRGQTISGVTITGTTAQFTSGTFVSLTGTTLQGTTATYTTGSFTSLTGTTTSGTTANFVSGVFSTQISGATVTGTTASFTSGNFTNISGGTHTITSGVFAAGTAANPSISFTSDPNTGIYSPGADQVAISTNGTGRLFVDASGNVGVGATTAFGKLDVSPSANKHIVFTSVSDYASNGIAAVNDSGSEIDLGIAGANLRFFTSATERMRLDSSGRLGLGTSSAQTRLHVQDSIAGGSGGTVATLQNFSDTGADTRYVGLNFRIGSDNGTSAIRAYRTNSENNYETNLSFWTNPAGATQDPVRAMTIDSYQRVGIGTTSPSSKLSIVTSANSPALDITDASTSDFIITPGVSSGVCRIGPATGAMALYTGNIERARIDSSGRLGLGTSSPAQLLETQDGNIQIRNSGALSQNTLSTYGLTFRNTNQIGQDRGTIAEIKTYLAGAGDNDFGLQFRTQATTSGGVTTKMTLTPGGSLGIGTTTPVALFQVGTGNTTAPAAKSIFNTANTTDAGIFVSNWTGSSTTNGPRIAFDNSGHGGWNIGGGNGTNTFVIADSASDRLTIDSSGRLLVGTSSAQGDGRIQIQGSNATGKLTMWRDNAPFGFIDGTAGASVEFGASPYSDVFGIGATISFAGDGTWGSGDYPGRLVFSTTADGASSPTERMRITSAGNVTIGTDGTTTIYNQTSVTGAVIERAGAIQLARSGDQSLLINRISNDGDLVSFFQDGTFEGSISVSGTTVSYNGAHLSRWSQLPSGAERTKILRGSVLSNLDEMCEWDEEDNEQLNRMKVSDVEGDKNVSGVFQGWDDDDDTYTDDFYCAMTGDFIIRIAEGVTVQRGDLLMSAGDGTAKPQDDDIIRSKTIAKVTSNHITCTYDDGSYCVPCVLMAC